MITSTFNKVRHLIQTRPGIIVTNVCNLSCGGCYAQCGKFSKDKMWFISISQFRENLDYIVKYMYQGKARMLNGEDVDVNIGQHGIDIIGGEPTVHPEWNEIWKIITEYTSVRFLISSNGRFEFPPATNVDYHIDYKTRTTPSTHKFYPTLVAPIDIVGNQDKSFYWDQAQKDCGIWKSIQCVNPIYKNQISICSVASSWNDLLDLDLGWNLSPNKNPFVDLTDEDVKEKASKVCYRCGWSTKIPLPEDQQSHLYDLVSDTNLEVLTRNSRSKPHKIVSVKDGKILIGDLKNSKPNFVDFSLSSKKEKSPIILP